MLRWLMTGRLVGHDPGRPVLVALRRLGAVLLLGRTPFGRRVYGIGNGPRAARLSGIPVERTLILRLRPLRALRRRSSASC